MSCIYKGSILETDQSRLAMGGTEQMRVRLINGVDSDLLCKVAVHLSRVRQVYDDVPNILWCHDHCDDPENKILLHDGWKSFSKLIFVTSWQRDMYIQKYGIPLFKCVVIENAIEPATSVSKGSDKIQLIYHTTPHRGLALLVPIFEALARLPEFKDKLHLDVFSSFEVYGWKQRDRYYEDLFRRLRTHPNATYHGAQPNNVVRDYLSKAHYFPYPCIWQETSCIALIEAIEHKVLAVHPRYGALSETAGQNTISYDWIENPQEHAEMFYSIIAALIKNGAHNETNINSRPDHNIESFVYKWTNLLKEYQ